MIRINLSKSRVASDAGDVNVSIQQSEGSSQNRDILVKIAVLLMGPLGLWIYESQNINSLRDQLAQIQVQVQTAQTDLDTKNQQLEEMKDIIPQAQTLAGKLKLLSEMSKLRLRELTSLDFIQSVIPEKLWLKNLKYENQRYQFIGNSVDTADLTEFVNRLEGSAYFQDVIVVQDKENSTQQQGAVREFEVSARVEKSK